MAVSSKASWIPFSRDTVRLAWCSCHQITPPPCKQRHRELAVCSGAGGISQAGWKQQHSPTLALRTTSPSLTSKGGGETGTNEIANRALRSCNSSTEKYYTPNIPGIPFFFPTCFNYKGNLGLVHSRFSYLRARLSYRLESIQKQCCGIMLLFFFKL